jgi:hypothetical protein
MDVNQANQERKSGLRQKQRERERERVPFYFSTPAMPIWFQLLGGDDGLHCISTVLTRSQWHLAQEHNVVFVNPFY